MNRDEFLKKLHPAITHVSASDTMRDETLNAINAMVDKVYKMTYEEITTLSKENNPIMTRDEAIEAMKKGWKVTHEYFTPEEWITMRGEKILLEDGVECTQEEFWAGRIPDFSFIHELNKSPFETGWTKWFPET
jgi:hypothetical protein